MHTYVCAAASLALLSRQFFAPTFASTLLIAGMIAVRNSQVVALYGTEVEFTKHKGTRSLATEQFWGRAVRASRDSQEFRGASYFHPQFPTVPATFFASKDHLPRSRR